MKITKVERLGDYYNTLVDANERKVQKAKINTILSLGGASLMAALSVSNIVNMGDADALTCIRDVILSLGAAYSGIWINGSIRELTDRESKKKDYQTITHCLKTNDGDMMAKFLEEKYPGLYEGIKQNIMEGKTR